MFRFQVANSVLLAPTRTSLLVKCAECSRKLPSDCYVKSPNALLHRSRSVVCLGCKRQCEGCGARLSTDRFYKGGNVGAGGSLATQSVAESSSHVGMCIRCTADLERAKHNVFFRYPTLKYKATPMPIERFRSSITGESSSSPPDSQ